jgi:predicted regulator of Ras-like GTPase activity (Roadblock/LC7/MglB family)
VQRPPLASETLGDLYRTQGRLEEAAAVYEEVLRRTPGREDVRRKLRELREPGGEGAAGTGDAAGKEGPMGFREHLERVAKGADGVLYCAVMGLDGIAIDSVQNETDIDVSNLMVEYSSMFKQLMANTDMLQTGDLNEISIRSERVVTVARPLGQEYFVALSMRPDANLGKARYLLRIAAPRIGRELA